MRGGNGGDRGSDWWSCSVWAPPPLPLGKIIFISLLCLKTVIIVHWFPRGRNLSYYLCSIHVNWKIEKTRLSYNCAHLRWTKETLTIEYFRIILKKIWVTIFLGENFWGENFLGENLFWVKRELCTQWAQILRGKWFVCFEEVYFRTQFDSILFL